MQTRDFRIGKAALRCAFAFALSLPLQCTVPVEGVANTSTQDSTSANWTKEESKLIEAFDDYAAEPEGSEAKATQYRLFREMASEDLLLGLGKKVIEKSLSESDQRLTLNLFAALEDKALPAIVQLVHGYPDTEFNVENGPAFARQLQETISRHPDQWRLLLPLLTDSTPPVKKFAIHLGSDVVGDFPEAAKVWTRIALDPDVSLEYRVDAVRAFRHCPELPAETLQPFVDHLLSEDEALLFSITRLLSTHASASMPLLIPRLATSSDPQKLAILNCLSEMGEEPKTAAVELESLMQSPSPAVRFCAARTYWQCTHHAAPVVATLRELLESAPNSEVLLLTYHLGPEAADLLPSLLPLIKETREKAIYDPMIIRCIGQMGPAARDASGLLSECLSDAPNKWICAVVIASVQIQEDSTSAVQELDRRLKSRMALWTAAKQKGDQEGNAESRTLEKELRDIVHTARHLGLAASPLTNSLMKLSLLWKADAKRYLPLHSIEAIGPTAIPVLEQTLQSAELDEAFRQRLEKLRARLQGQLPKMTERI